MKTFDTVIFDLDDTVYPRRQYILSGCKAVAKYMSHVYGLDCRSDMEHACLSSDIHQGIAQTLGKYFSNNDQGLVTRLIHVFRCHKPVIRLHQDAQICLALLRSMGIKLGVISKDLPDVQETKMAALELQDLLDLAYYGRDDDGRDTMADAFSLLELLSETPGSRTVFVGNDTTTDFDTPRDMGITTVCVSRDQAKPHFPHATAHITIRSLVDLMDALAGLEDINQAKAS